MELSLDDIKLLVGGLALDIVSRDKTITLLTTQINEMSRAQAAQVHPFPKEVNKEEEHISRVEP